MARKSGEKPPPENPQPPTAAMARDARLLTPVKSYKVVQSMNYHGNWRVEVNDPYSGTQPDCVAVFAERERAEEYADWKNEVRR